MDYSSDYWNQNEAYREVQKHVHEIQGSVKMADMNDPHTHRFCTVTGEAMSVGGRCEHVHEVVFRTDYHGDHYHEFRGRTGCSIPVGDRHIHYLESITSMDDGHRHEFEFATLIENPTGDHHDHENRNEEEDQNWTSDDYGYREDHWMMDDMEEGCCEEDSHEDYNPR